MPRSAKVLCLFASVVALAFVVVAYAVDGIELFGMNASGDGTARGRSEADTVRPERPPSTAPGGRKLKNVLLIIVDDLRPQLGAYHDPEHPDYFGKLKIHTPNLDKLASRSMVFKRAYAQFSLCGPSRTSLLTSRRPDVTRVYNNVDYWRVVGGNFTTLPQHFKNNGYTAVGLGKVFHPLESSNNDDPASWTEPYYRPPCTDRKFVDLHSVGGWAAASDERSERLPLADIGTTRRAKSILSELSERADGGGGGGGGGRRPFIMAVGYNKPHLHLVCPEAYFRLYALEDERRFLANATWQTPVLRPYVYVDGARFVDGLRVLPSDELRRFRRAYFACVSYVDAQVGQLLGHLDDVGLGGDTVVCLAADHGFHLGENRLFGKLATTEVASRVPLMIRIPGVTDSGADSESVVELLDVFPTLVEAAGLDPIPACPRRRSDVPLCTQGTSLMPLIGRTQAGANRAALSQVWHRYSSDYTLRTRHFRLVERAVVSRDVTSLKNRSLDPSRTELYDHRNDIHEQVNVASDRKYQNVLNKLRKKILRLIKD